MILYSSGKNYPDFISVKFVTTNNEFNFGIGLLIIGIGLYFKFGRYFTEAAKQFLRFSKIIFFAEGFLLLLVLLTYCYYLLMLLIL